LYDVRKSGRSEWAMDANLVCQALPALGCKGFFHSQPLRGVWGQKAPKKRDDEIRKKIYTKRRISLNNFF